MITINREKWADCIAELMPLCEQVFSLVEADITGLPLDFDTEMYHAVERCDRFHCLVMRENGKAIGFHWLFFTPMMRHKGHIHAHTDAIFVLPEHRKHSAKLLEYSTQYIKERASFWTLANLQAKDNSKLWQHKGFESIETIMFKKLGE